MAFAERFVPVSEERMAVAIAQLMLEATGGEECVVSSASGTGCAQAGRCVGPGAVCSDPEGFLSCCNSAERCMQLPGAPDFRCESMVTAARMGVEPVECN